MSWKHKLLQDELTIPKGLDEEAEMKTLAKREDIGFVDPETGIGILARESKLEGYADYGLGFVFDKEHQALNIFAPRVRMFTSDVQVHDEVKHDDFIKEEEKDVLRFLREDDES